MSTSSDISTTTAATVAAEAEVATATTLAAVVSSSVAAVVTNITGNMSGQQQQPIEIPDTNTSDHTYRNSTFVQTVAGEGIAGSAANRLIGEVVQSRRRPLLGPSPG